MKHLFSLLLVLVCLFSLSSVTAESPCQHSNTFYGPVYEEGPFFYAESETHHTDFRKDLYCSDCGQWMGSLLIETVEEEHTFGSDGKCIKCGYTLNCSHPNPELDYSLKYPHFFDDKEHIYPLEYRYYCPDCGELWWEVQPGETIYEAHTYDENGTCTHCGYNKKYDKLAPNPNIVPEDPVAKKGMVQIGSWIITPVKMDIRKFDSPESRHSSYAGPGTQYESTGGYLPQKIRDAYGWFVDGDYVLTDVSYATLKRSMVYLKKSAFTSTDGLPMIDITQNAHPGTVTTETVPSMFPQKNRRMFTAQTVKLTAGTEITVYFEKGGWYYCEFACSDKMPARGWLPRESVEVTLD